jgi:hypothetical protein
VRTSARPERWHLGPSGTSTPSSRPCSATRSPTSSSWPRRACSPRACSPEGRQGSGLSRERHLHPGRARAALADPRILEDRRLLYALKGLAALRHTEAATLAGTSTTPPANHSGASRSRRRRPRSPARSPSTPPSPACSPTGEPSAGSAPTAARQPRLTSSSPPERHQPGQGRGPARPPPGSRRPRPPPPTGHDLRRTFITLAQVDGSRRDLLQTVTHGPRGDIISVYTTFPWPALCTEVAKLQITLARRPRCEGVCYRSCYRPAKGPKALAKSCDPTGSFELVNPVMPVAVVAPRRRMAV